MIQAALLAAALLSAGTAAAPAEERFALLAGRNDGFAGRPKLRFAEADAARFADTLVELGGFPRGHVRLLAAPGRDELLRGITDAGNAIRAAKAKGAGRALLVVYFSGHAGDDGLELGGELVRFTELKAALDASPAEVRVAFVDACRAGALTRAKGATAVAEEFEVTVASDSSPDGTAIIASTAAGEDALESAELRGSPPIAIVTGLAALPSSVSSTVTSPRAASARDSRAFTWSKPVKSGCGPAYSTSQSTPAIRNRTFLRAL
mgnify:CR=1 FL=1